MQGQESTSTMATEAEVYVQERFSAFLVWECSPIDGVFELNVNLSSASRLSFVEYTHSSRSYQFAVGSGLIGRAAGLPTGSLLRLELTPDVTTTDYHRVMEARAAGVKATSALHWKEGVVIEFVSSSEQELDADEERQSCMLCAFANEFSAAGSSASSIIAAHTILRQQMEATDAHGMTAEEQMEATDAHGMTAEASPTVTPASSELLRQIGEPSCQLATASSFSDGDSIRDFWPV